MIEITGFAKEGGVLTKHISLSADGEIRSDGSACIMSTGRAVRVRLNGLDDLAKLIGQLDPNEAIALGALRQDLPDEVTIATKQRLEDLNGSAASDIVSRTSGHIQFRAGETAFALIDFDQKGMPDSVRSTIEGHGGVRKALGAVVPGMLTVGGVMRPSTSSGLKRADTGSVIPASGGFHWFVLIKDGSDGDRFLRALHARCWLHGLGWLVVSDSGQLLERSVIDRMVGAAERLVFEAPPIVAAPLEQDQEARAPRVTPGEAIDTRLACPDLTTAEAARFRDLKAAEAYKLRDKVEAKRSAFISRQTASVVTRLGVSQSAARRIVERQCDGVLLPGVELPFDADEFAGKTVADVFSDPDRFVGATLADPLEGIEYGRGKAKIMRRADGTLWINSFAHGRTSYELRHDANSVEAAIRAADPQDAAEALVDKLLAGDVTPGEEQRLRDLVVERGGVKSRPLAAMIKHARAEQQKERGRAERARQIAERTDPRFRLPAPPSDSERTPVLRDLDCVLSRVADPEPPMRDLGGLPVEVRSRLPLLMHELTSSGSNAEESSHTRLPPPELPLLTPHDKFSLGHLIERHIEYVTEDNRSVALPPVFVDHYLNYRDSILPRVGAVVTTPLVLPDGTLLAITGIDRLRRLVFRIDPALLPFIPTREECTQRAVAEALNYLISEWLVDVEADFTDKCVLVAGALTIIERVLLPERPAFFITAGQRGGGKTTVVIMLVLAVTGKKPPAAAWSPNEEERRKALLAYLMEGIAALVWDNIPRGMGISCPHIEKALTSEDISDRILGQSESRVVSSTTVPFFTGNNIGPKGDMASRSLSARINVTQPDPENRPFKHQDPVAWTLNNRGRILRSLYTVLLGNPQLDQKHASERKTRFKTWWHLVGSAVENAAALLAAAEPEPKKGEERKTCRVNFKDLLTAFEAEEEQTSGLVGVLDILNEMVEAKQGSDKSFLAADVAKYINEPMHGEHETAALLRASIEQASGRALPAVTSTTIAWRLKAFVDAPVKVDDMIVTLRLVRPKPGSDELGGPDKPVRKKHDLARFRIEKTPR